MLCGRWATLTAQPKDEVLLQQAKSLLAEELELIGSVAVEIWDEINCTFMEQGISSFSAAHFFILQAVDVSKEADSHPGEMYDILKVRRLKQLLIYMHKTFAS